MKDNLCTVYKLLFHKMQSFLVHNGYELVDDAFKSDICLAGVCAAFRADEKRSIALVNDMKKTGKPVYVYGCMTQVNPSRIGSPLQFASWRADYLMKELTREDVSFWNEGSLPNDFRCKSDYRIYNPHKKFIGISTGCSFHCSYCPHQKGSGKIMSLSPKDILGQIRSIDPESVETIVITGIDTACYGVDIGSSFSALLKQILEILDQRVQVHIAQFNPEGLFFNGRTTRELLDLFSDKRIRDIQLPVQTASRRLLKLMHRDYSLNKLEGFITSLRSQNDSVMLRTDLLVGFPTETVAELDRSIDYVCRLYSEIAVYAFEMKKGTPISSLGLPAIDAEEVERRRRHALENIRGAGLLAHSGGQKIKTLLDNDRAKETIRR